jgi:predicted transcriptional regulator of viral defense system
MNLCYHALREETDMIRQLELIDNLVAEGRGQFTFEEAVRALHVSPPAAANALRRLQEKGLVDRLTKGVYAIRPLGSLGTSAATDDLPLAVGAAFRGIDHRIAYATALSEHGLLSHPVRTIYVACTRQVRIEKVSRRPLRVVIEREKTIHLGAEQVGLSWRSTVERALFESALRLDLVGGPEQLAEALANAAEDINPTRIHRLATNFGARGRAAERRLASLSHALELPLDLDPKLESRRPMIQLDPSDDRQEWVDERYRVAWNLDVDELRAVVGA